MGCLDNKVAFITGAARGQGRSHAIRLAQEGADIVALDICEDIPTLDYATASQADLDETVNQVEALDRRIMARKADVRDANAIKAVADEGFETFGRIDIALGNAGVTRLAPGADEDEVQLWDDIVATNLTGAFHMLRAVVPKMIEGGRGGVIVLTGSTAGVRPKGRYEPGRLAYTASKFGLVGICEQMASALGEHSIRVNIVHPTGVATGMTMNGVMDALMAEAAAGTDNSIAGMRNAMPVGMLQPEDISDAIAFLCSDQAKWITGTSLPVDAGYLVH
jgi:SDR family mycofactocin-dependent oxidoreductase